MHCVNYKVSAHSSTKVATLVDKGMARFAVSLFETEERCADISGINDHQISNLPIFIVAGLVQTQHGSVVAIIHQVAYHGKGAPFFPVHKWRHTNNKVDDRPIHVGGKQRIETWKGASSLSNAEMD